MSSKKDRSKGKAVKDDVVAISTVIKRAVTRWPHGSQEGESASSARYPLPVEKEYMVAIFACLDMHTSRSGGSATVHHELWNSLMKYVSRSTTTRTSPSSSSSPTAAVAVAVVASAQSEPMRALFILDAVMHQSSAFRSLIAGQFFALIQPLMIQANFQSAPVGGNELLDYFLELVDVWDMLYSHEDPHFSTIRRYLRESLRMEAPSIQERLERFERKKREREASLRSRTLNRASDIVGQLLSEVQLVTENALANLSSSIDRLFPDVLATSSSSSAAAAPAREETLNGKEKEEDDAEDDLWASIEWESEERFDGLGAGDLDDEGSVDYSAGAMTSVLPTVLQTTFTITLQDTVATSAVARGTDNEDVLKAVSTLASTLVQNAVVLTRWKRTLQCAVGYLRSSASSDSASGDGMDVASAKRPRIDQADSSSVNSAVGGSSSRSQLGLITVAGMSSQSAQALLGSSDRALEITTDLLQRIQHTLQTKCKNLLICSRNNNGRREDHHKR